MATKYTLYFTDTNKTPFDLQSYTTNGPESPSDPSPISGSSGNIATTLKLYGKGNKDYGEPVFQDLIYMLENFANDSRPFFSLEGQMWYNNKDVAGSPAIKPELLIRNDEASDGYSSGSPALNVGWDAVILATGSSAMTGELTLSANPELFAATSAVPKIYVDSTTAPLVHTHVWADVTDVAPSLVELDTLTGVTSNIQTQLNDKVSISVNTVMFSGVNLTFLGGGEVLGLPASPSGDAAAASKKYVDDQIAGTGDGALTSTEWLNTGLGSPLPDTSETTLRLTVTQPGSPAIETTFDAQGISRAGHIHTATDTSIDNSFDVTYGTNVQTAIEKAASEIDLLITGGIPPSATITVQRIFNILTSPLTVAGSPIDTFMTQNHTADDNRVVVSVNGVKQYAHSRGEQDITYTLVSSSTLTGLNPAQTYDFNIAVDGGGPATVTINAGSPATDISTHAALVSAINAQLSGSPSIPATFSITSGTSETFTSHTSGGGSSIVISDPAGSPNEYLFTGGSPFGLIDFVEVAAADDGLTGEFMETDSLGVQILPENFTSYIVFNYDILTGSKIESLLYV